MVGSDVTSTNHERPAGVVECFQRSENGVSSASSEVMAVLKSEPTRPDLADDPDRVEVKARARPFDPFALGVGATDVLAWGTADNDGRKSSKIIEKSVCRESADIVVKPDMRIVLGVERAPPRLDFARGDRREPGAVHAERPAAGGGAEEIEHLHHDKPLAIGRASARSLRA